MHYAVRNILLDLGAIRNDIFKWEKQIDLLDKAKEIYEGFEPTISIGHSRLGKIHGLLFMVHSLKAKCDFDDIIDWFIAQGCTHVGNDTYAELRRYSVELKIDNVPIQVIGFFEGGSCEFVQVGTENRPVYEFRCTKGEN